MKNFSLFFIFSMIVVSPCLAEVPPPASQPLPGFISMMSKSPDKHSQIYTVVPGDNLTKVARRYRLTPDLLKTINGVDEKKLRPGMKLKIPTYQFSLLVDKKRNTLTLLGDQEPLKVYVVSTGTNNSTPEGTFKVTDKLVQPVWYHQNRAIPSGSPDNQLGTRWIGIDKKSYGIHGTIEPEKLGQQVTAGCVRMKNEEVEELYQIVVPGTEVTIA